MSREFDDAVALHVGSAALDRDGQLIASLPEACAIEDCDLCELHRASPTHDLDEMVRRSAANWTRIREPSRWGESCWLLRALPGGS